MNVLDWAIVAFVIFGAIKGYREGFLLELFSLLGIVLGILGAFKLLGVALVFLKDRFDIDEKVLPYVAFALVFILILVAVTLIGRMLKASIDKSFLGRVDQAAGSVLGLVKVVFILSVLVWVTSSLSLQLPEKWTRDSSLMPYLSDFAPQVTSVIAEVIPAFNDIF